MCTIPPAPPPPPAGFNLCVTSSTNATVDKSSIDKFYGICEWVTSDPELREACIRNVICIDDPPYKYIHRRYESILQIGPTCGLVALAMILKGDVSPEELLNISRAAGYSNNGEMFSCQDMAQLAKEAFNLAEYNNVSVEVRKGGLYSKKTIVDLVNGAVLLVAYDADCNHSPCMRKGHTAHWALICGIILVNDPKDDYTSDPSNVFVLARHGKSKYLSAWPLEQLDRSNKNLQEFSPKKQEDGLLYILPEGGMGGEKGLRDQFLIFTGL